MEDEDLLYVVLEPPADLARWTYDCRRTWKRVWRPDIPPALGGMGPLSAPLDPRICASRLEQLCALQPPAFTRFLELRQFPGHPFVYLPPTAARELDAFAARLAAAGFSMHDNPFGHIHHFGVAFFEPEADECVRLALSTSDIPAGVYGLISSSYTSFPTTGLAASGAGAVQALRPPSNRVCSTRQAYRTNLSTTPRTRLRVRHRALRLGDIPPGHARRS